MNDLWSVKGGPAFPARYDDNEGSTVNYRGMSLLDHFAGLAMHAVLSNQAMLDRIGKRTGGDIEKGHEEIAAGAYALAESMLAERSK